MAQRCVFAPENSSVPLHDAHRIVQHKFTSGSTTGNYTGRERLVHYGSKVGMIGGVHHNQPLGVPPAEWLPGFL
jgi:hypothetical protein